MNGMDRIVPRFDEPKRTGRPEALTDALKLEVCARIADGETIRAIAYDEHMPAASTIYLALAKDPVFSEQYAQAREAQLTRWEDELVEIADDADPEEVMKARLRVDTRKWIMSKRAPKKYGERVTQEMETTDGQPVAFPIVRVYSPKPKEESE